MGFAVQECPKSRYGRAGRDNPNVVLLAGAAQYLLAHRGLSRQPDLWWFGRLQLQVSLPTSLTRWMRALLLDLYLYLPQALARAEGAAIP